MKLSKILLNQDVKGLAGAKSVTVELIVNIPDKLVVNSSPSGFEEFRNAYVTWFCIFVPV